jgi:hypothetical protein
MGVHVRWLSAWTVAMHAMLFPMNMSLEKEEAGRNLTPPRLGQMRLEL